MLASADPLDPTTTELQRPADYTSFLAVTSCAPPDDPCQPVALDVPLAFAIRADVTDPEL